MLAAGTWVWHLLGHDLIGLKIERVADNQLVGFASPKLSHLDELAVQSGIGRNDHRLLVRDSFDQPEGRRDDVHFPIADQDVAVAAETFDALVLMRIFVISIQEIAVADDQVKHGIGIAVWFLRVAPKT